MTIEDEDQKIDSSHDSLILELIYEDANESIKFLRDDINSINTKLALLIGFNATFTTLLLRLSNQTNIRVHVQDMVNAFVLYPHAGQLFEQLLSFINWCLLIKPLVTILLILSITLSIWSVVSR